MSAAEVIERIKALPPDEQQIGRNFLLNGDAGGEGGVAYLDREEAGALGDKVMEENEELFRRLAK